MKTHGKRRLRRLAGRESTVDGIHFVNPIDSDETPALMAGFSIDAQKAAKFLPGEEVHPFRLWKRGLLIITAIDYRATDIGKYIEFSIAIACTRSRRPAMRFLPLLFRGAYGMGQFVMDLPVSTEISVKGGKGIWGMPKHIANLRFDIGDETASSQYDCDGQFCVKIEVVKSRPWIPLNASAASYAAFRGMLTRSHLYFQGKAGMTLGKEGAARLTIGDHPRVQWLRELDIAPRPVFSAWLPQTRGMLDDYGESWFLTYDGTPPHAGEGLECVAHLGCGQQWLNQPFASATGWSPSATPAPQSAQIGGSTHE